MAGVNKAILLAVITIVLIPIIIILAPGLLPVLLLVGILILKQKYPVIKGAVGEWFVNRELTKLGPNYTVFHDLYIPTKDGGTTQIDHIVTSPYGVFVIETKHYQGWIFGNENQRYWTQVIYKRKEKLFNPIWQNYGHIQALKNYLGDEDIDFHSIIAFSPNSTFKFNEEFKSARVIQFPQLTKVIKERNVEKLSIFELNQINKNLKKLVIEDSKEKKRVKREHVDTIKNNRKEKVKKVMDNICPKCGGTLSMKKGKYGSFYGCSNFPKCRFTGRVS